MPDPQVLYVVTAVVVLALLAWVIAVLSRTEDAREEAPKPAASSERKEADVGASGDPGPSSKTIPADPPAEALSSKSHPAAAASAGPAPAHGAGADGANAEVTVEVEEEEEPTGPNALILVTAVGRTDPGLKRKHNEDAYVILEKHHLFAIADGMGRHAAGEIASKLAVDAIADAFKSGAKPTVPMHDASLPKRANMLRSAIHVANERIFAQSHEVDEYAGMGTTIVSAFFSPNNQRVYIAHVGDSRCYRLRGDAMTQLTKDHTLGAAGIQGKSSSVLSRAVGIEENVEVDVAMESPLPGDTYLLCSDGLSRMLTDPEIQGALNTSKDLEAVTAKLIEMANARGGRDNITAILVRVDSAKEAVSSPPVADAKRASGAK